MPRQRMVKPEFWASRTLCECSLQARLLFIATWNYADDEGRLQWDVKLLKAFAFPLDSFKFSDVQKWMDELVQHGLILEYLDEATQRKYALVRSFTEHQYINRPRQSEFADSIFTEQSLNAHGALTTHSLPKSNTNTKPNTNGKHVHVDFLSEFPNVQSLKRPMTEFEHGKLIDEHGADAVMHILNQMENYAPLKKKYQSAYLTARNWLSRDPKPPTRSNVADEFARNNWSQEEAEGFYTHYAKTGWHDKNGNKIHNWKAAAAQWMHRPKT